MKKGFGLIQTLIIILLVSGLMTMALKYASLTAKHTADSYLRERAELFMKSAIELTLLAISGYDRKTNGNCLQKVKVTSADQRFIADINITKYYLLQGSDDCSYCGSRCQPIQTEDSHGLVMLEVKVESNDTSPRNQGREKIRLLRRTLQRP